MEKGRLIAQGLGMVSMLNTCYNSTPKLTDENSIMEVDVKTDEWKVFEKL